MFLYLKIRNRVVKKAGETEVTRFFIVVKLYHAVAGVILSEVLALFILDVRLPREIIEATFFVQIERLHLIKIIGYTGGATACRTGRTFEKQWGVSRASTMKCFHKSKVQSDCFVVNKVSGSALLTMLTTKIMPFYRADDASLVRLGTRSWIYSLV